MQPPLVRDRSRSRRRTRRYRTTGIVAAATCLAVVGVGAVVFGVQHLGNARRIAQVQEKSLALDTSPPPTSPTASPPASASDPAASDPVPSAATAPPTAAARRAASMAAAGAGGRAGTQSAAPHRSATAPGTTGAGTTGAGARTATSAGAAAAVDPGPAAAPGTATGTGRIRFGTTYHGNGTFYGATGAGNCMFDAGSDRMIAAMNHTDYDNSQACGAWVAVTGPSGATITVKIVDQCPECAPGAIDLSAEAFAKLAAPSAGRIPITWHLLSPQLSGPVSYVYKSGSSQYWCAIQVRDHRNPVAALEVKAGGGWRALPRQDYNYFLSADGAGCGGDIRVTDIYGNQVTDTGIGIRPGVVQSGRAQLGAPH